MLYLAILKMYPDSQPPDYPPEAEVPLEGIVPQNLRPWVIRTDQEGQVKVNRINYELCVLQALRQQLRCKEVWVVGADKHRNPDEDLPQDFAARREHYYQLVSQPLDAESFIQAVRADMRQALSSLNESLPQNEAVVLRQIGQKQIKLSPLEAQAEPPYWSQLKGEIARRWGMLQFLDMVKETALRTEFTRPFKSVTAWQNLTPAELQKRLLLCIYARGTNIGLKRVSLADPSCIVRALRHRPVFGDIVPEQVFGGWSCRVTCLW